MTFGLTIVSGCELHEPSLCFFLPSVSLTAFIYLGYNPSAKVFHNVPLVDAFRQHDLKCLKTQEATCFVHSGAMNSVDYLRLVLLRAKFTCPSVFPG